MKGRCEISQKDAGCEQFEVFQSALNPDRLVLLERWTSQAALDAHAQLQRARPALPPGRRQGKAERGSGLLIDDAFELGRLLHRQLGRVRPLQDAVDVSGRPAEYVG